MCGRRISVVFMDQAKEFIRALPEKAQKKITYNLLRVEGGDIDKEIFKKLENSDIWEFRTEEGDRESRGIAYMLLQR